MWQKIILFILLFISPLAIASPQSVSFEPGNVTLEGHIIILKFPGPPNYESIKKGDQEEIGAYLILNKPIDIEAPTNTSNFDEAQKNVKLIQLIVSNHQDWKQLKQGNYVRLTGTLSSPMTGHHHARALLEVKKVEVISQQEISQTQLKNISQEDMKFIKSQHVQE